MTTEGSNRLPYVKTSAPAMEALAFALTPIAGEGGTDIATTEARKVHRKKKWASAKNKNKKRKRLYGMQHSGKPSGNCSSAGADADEEGDDDSDDDDVPPMDSGGWESALGASDATGVPCAAVCQLSGVLMHDPVAAPEGHLFERAALEDWIQSQSATNPLTGTPMTMDQVAPATQVQSYIQGYQMQMLSACQIAPGAFEEPPALDDVQPTELYQPQPVL